MSTAKYAPVANSVLRALSRPESRRLLASYKQVNLTYGDILCEPGERIEHVYFLNDGIISLLAPVKGHMTVEVGLVGREGMAGMPLLLGVNVSPVRMLVQGTGTAMRMPAASFRNEIKRNTALQHNLSHYLYALMVQVAQTAACNSCHLLGARLARWLLMTHDRIQANEFHLTQEFLAHMLGVRRAGVTKAAGVLQKKRLIRYSRGNITILDRKGLERVSCECYRVVNDLCDRMPG
jgi:CRP-like cAMP-binding protein